MAFSTHDIVPDSPTNRFATLNPLNFRGSGAILSDGNLKLSGGGNHTGSFATIPIQKTGAWYVEVRTNDTTDNHAIHLQPNQHFNLSNQSVPESITINTFFSTEISIREYGSTTSSSTVLGSVTETTTTSGDVLGYLFDFENNTIIVNKNGVHKLTVTNLTPLDDVYLIGYNVSSTYPAANKTFNFGIDPTFGSLESPSSSVLDKNGLGSFLYNPKDSSNNSITNFLALCTANLPEFTPTVTGDTPQDYFKAVTYTGDSNDNHSISTVGFQPDLIWIKNRSAAGQHVLIDSVRGDDRELFSSNTNAEQNPSTTGHVPALRSFDSTGFTLSPNINPTGSTNSSPDTFVAWCWKAGGAPTAAEDGTGVTGSAKIINEDGTQADTTCAALASATGASNVITPSKVSANRQNGFSITAYSGNGSAGATVPHGLDKAPEFILYKRLTTTSQDWGVYHISSSKKLLQLNTANGYWSSGQNYWEAIPSNTVFYPDNTNSDHYQNISNADYIAYCWHSVAGYSKFGSYTGNGSADGPFVYTGFRPSLLITRNTAGGVWIIEDNGRNPNNPVDDVIYANSSDAGGTTTNRIDFLSNGFKIRHSAWFDQNGNNSTILYMCWAEMPFKYANAR